jgi:membrane protease YdiL (CAAX protease family)
MKLLHIIIVLIYIIILISQFAIKKKTIKYICGITEIFLIIFAVFNNNLYFSNPKSLLFVAALLTGYLSYLLSLFIVGTDFKLSILIPADAFRSNKVTLRAMGKNQLKSMFTSIYEEFVFRGAFFGGLLIIPNFVFIAIIITSITFALAHYSGNKAVIQIIDILIFSVILCLFYYFTKCIWTVCIIHVARNFLVICNGYSIAYKKWNYI